MNAIQKGILRNVVKHAITIETIPNRKILLKEILVELEERAR